MKIDTPSGAHFSDCRKFRYGLWRVWNDKAGLCQFIGLNPSTANELKDDPTIRRVASMAKSWGFGGIVMTNLFAMVTPYPKDLITTGEPEGANLKYLSNVHAISEMTVFAWGNFNVLGRDQMVKDMFPGAMALHINKNGSPKHPLYVRSDVKPINYLTAIQNLNENGNN